MNDDVKLAKWLNNELDAKELADFEAAPEFATYDKIKRYSAELVAPATDMDALYARIKEGQVAPKTTEVRRLPVWVPRVAALFVIAIGLGMYFYTAKITSHNAVAGSMATFTLPDNSEVVLNAGSDATYKAFNWTNNRKLELNGEAYFKAAKGKTFDVVTPLGTVTVVGTRFDVKARENRLDVTCYEGKVKVTTPKGSVLLTAGQSVAYNNDAKLALPNVTKSEPGWVNRHEVDFSFETPGNVLAEMERQFNVKIKVKGSLPFKGGYSGTLPTKQLETTLDLFLPAYGLSYKKQGNEIILSAE
jgi:ferric-dicitrate binding protein FerR (iron transport regulator)